MKNFRKSRESQGVPWNQVHSELWLRSYSFRAKPNTQPLNFKVDGLFIPKGYCWEFHRGLHCPGLPSVFDAGNHTPLPKVPSQNLSQVKGQSPTFPLSGALPTPVKVERKGYNIQAYEELLSDFLHGFGLHFHGPQIGQVSTNLFLQHNIQKLLIVN